MVVSSQARITYRKTDCFFQTIKRQIRKTVCSQKLTRLFNRFTICYQFFECWDIDTVKTHPIKLEAAAESFKKEVPLNLPETIAVAPPLRIVVALVELCERIITRVLKKIPVAGKGTTSEHRIDPQTIALTVSGPEGIVKAIESDPAFSVSVDLKGLSPGSHTLKAAIKLPVRTTLIEASPEHFTVTIMKQG